MKYALFEKGGGGSTLYEIYIGFCPRIDIHNIMHIDCLTYDYSICDIVFLLPIYTVKNSKVKLVCFSFLVFRYSVRGEIGLFFVFRFSFFAFRFSFFDIRIRADRILTFEILF